MSCRILNPSPSTLLHHRPLLSPIRNPNLRSAPRNSFYLSPFLPSNSPQTILSRNLNRVQKRCNSSPDECSLELQLLPFESHEVLVPSEIKTLHLYEARFLALHLYEARFLALLEEVVFSTVLSIMVFSRCWCFAFIRRHWRDLTTLDIPILKRLLIFGPYDID